METKMSNMFKTTTSQIWQRSFKKSYRVLQVTSKSKTLKQSVYFLKAVEFCPTVDIQIDISEKVAKPHFLEGP